MILIPIGDNLEIWFQILRFVSNLKRRLRGKISNKEICRSNLSLCDQKFTKKKNLSQIWFGATLSNPFSQMFIKYFPYEWNWQINPISCLPIYSFCKVPFPLRHHLVPLQQIHKTVFSLTYFTFITFITASIYDNNNRWSLTMLKCNSQSPKQRSGVPSGLQIIFS